MLTSTNIQQATEAVDALDTTGLRVVCMCCKRFLSGNPHALRTSHGICKPLCGEAAKMGWGAPTPTAANPLAPLIAQI